MPTMDLPVDLTDHEITIAAKKLTDELTRHDTVSAKKKLVSDLYKKRLETIDGRVQALRQAVATGTEIREVEVYEHRDLFNKKIVVRRLDTNGVVTERKMDEAELQLELGERAKEASTGGDVLPLFPSGDGVRAARERDETTERTEEQAIAANPEEAESLRDIRLQAEAAEREAEETATPGPEVDEVVDQPPADDAASASAETTGDEPGLDTAALESAPVEVPCNDPYHDAPVGDACPSCRCTF